MTIFSRLGGVARPALLGATLVLGALPASGATIFYGGGFVSDFIGCEGQGWRTTSVIARVTPAGYPENAEDENIIVFQLGGGTHVYVMPATGDETEFQTVEFWEIWSHRPYQNPNVQVRMRLIGWASDMPVDQNDPDFRVHGVIENFNQLEGCTARFGLSMRNPALAAN